VETKEVLRDRLHKIIKELIATCRALPDPNAAIYEGWSAKDILGHLAFWHESFARNVADLAHDRQPTPLKGTLGDLNQRGVEELRLCSLEEVIGRLQAAQRVIHRHILSPRITLIAYRKGSRDYTPEEHLSLVIDHITAHLKAIRRASTNE
jgi:uncharacterized damage-inducible protein DinB